MSGGQQLRETRSRLPPYQLYQDETLILAKSMALPAKGYSDMWAIAPRPLPACYLVGVA